MNTLNPLFQKRYCGLNNGLLKTNMKCFACILEKGWLQLLKASASTPVYTITLPLQYPLALCPWAASSLNPSFSTDPALHTYQQSDKSHTKIHKLCKGQLGTLLSPRHLHYGCFGGRKPTCWAPSPSADTFVKTKLSFWGKTNANPRKKWFTPNG